MNIHLELAMEKDLKTILDILNYGMRNKIRRGDLAWGMSDIDPNPIKQMILAGMFYIAYNESSPVGTCALSWQDTTMWGKQPDDAGYLQRLATNARYKGQGVGEQILYLLLQEVAKANRQYLRLATPANNPKLQSYYESCGFIRADYRIVSNIHPAFPAAYYEKPVNGSTIAIRPTRHRGFLAKLKSSRLFSEGE